MPATVWNDPITPNRERKRMLGLLIEDVTIFKQHQLTLSVRFRGGSTTILTLPRPLLPSETRATRPEVIRLIDDFANEHTDAQIAHLLNERGQVTGACTPFDDDSVRWVRTVQNLKSFKQRLLEAGWTTAKQLGSALGVGRHTLRRLHSQGRLRACICDNRGQWLYWPTTTSPLPKHPSPTTPAPEANPVAKGAV